MKAPLADKIFQRLSQKNSFTNFSFAQEGEDMILNRIFDNKENGTYVDVGAHHPFRFSNTYFFYKKGWRGINIEPMPGTMKIFDKHRPGDANVEAGVAEKAGDLSYYIFSEPALNTFDKERADYYSNRESGTLLETKMVPVYPLSEILDKYLGNRKIDFLTIDAEGFEMAVLLSNNWQKYKPTVILLESLTIDVENFMKEKEYAVMKDLGYRLFAKTYYTYIFMYA